MNVADAAVAATVAATAASATLAAAYAVTHGLLETRHDHHCVRAIFAKHKIRFDYNGYNITSPM